MRSKVPTHRVAQSQGSSRETSPERQRFGFSGANSVIQRQSELEAAVADALVSCGTVATFMKLSQGIESFGHNEILLYELMWEFDDFDMLWVLYEMNVVAKNTVTYKTFVEVARWLTGRASD